MDAEKSLKIAFFGAFSIIVILISLFVYSLDRPLGEGTKQLGDYGGDFSVTGVNGPVKLSDFNGKIVVIYFGFVSCKEACPISLAKLRKAFKELTDEEIKKVQVLLVSIDPERDKPEDVDTYIKKFHPSFIGLSDTKDTINALQKQYGVFSTKEILNGESSTYVVDHYSRFYLIDRQGKLIQTMSHTTTPNELLAKIKSLI